MELTFIKFVSMFGDSTLEAIGGGIVKRLLKTDIC